MGECEGNVILFHSNIRFNQAFELMAVTVIVSAFGAAHMPGPGGLGVAEWGGTTPKNYLTKILTIQGVAIQAKRQLNEPKSNV